MSLNLSTVKVITLFTDDLEASTSFYRRVFGLAAVYEDDNSAVFQFENLMINLLESPAAHDLIAPATVAGAESGARFQFTIEVEHVDSACEELARRGVTLLNGPVDRPWGIRTASFVDPGGHIWEVADG